MKSLNIELSNGRLLRFDKVKSYGLMCRTEEGGRFGMVGVFEIKEENGRTALINWDHLLFASCKEVKDDAEIH